ncbi:MAG TPA: FAD-linked oxidase C-terminal domain-containing protein [Terriglobales bacterium]|nr:FAD-linked oxidase C-terminal domain-containing protein [Terriglobales bacterium]
MSANELRILNNPTAFREPNWRKPDVDADALESALRKHVHGEVRFDRGSRGLYALDGSNYQQTPIGVVIPRTVEDAVAAINTAREFGAPILSRTGGTSLAGQCCNYAVVVDWTKYVNRITEVHPEEAWAWCEPGVIRDQLADAVCDHKLTYGPDPSTHTHCCIGGMIGNNSCGAHAQFGGKAVDNLEEMEVLLYDGTRMNVGWMDNEQLSAKIAAGGREGEIYVAIKSLRDRYAGLIRSNYPKIPRRVSGYNLDNLLPDEHGRFNIGRALVGSEGTLATILRAKVKLVYNHPQRVLLMLGYPDVYHAADHIMEVLESNPIALEGIDDVLVSNVRTKGGPHSKYISMLPEGNGWLMLEYGCDTIEEATEQAQRLMDRLKSKSDAPTMKLFTEKADEEKIWRLRESGLGATAFVPGEPITWEGWEDSAVAPERVGEYLRDLRALYNKYEYKSAMYGHFGMGCIHCRVSFDLFTKPGIEKYMRFLDEVTTMITSKYNGSLSGEHGDGQSKALFLDKMFGPELIEAFREFKGIWDPDWKMNPGKVVDPYRPDENLRLGPSYKPWQPKTHFQFPNDNGQMSHATLRCVGVGSCRRLAGEEGNDTMCASFMVTREEMHSTRGRAHLLWEMLKNGPDGPGLQKKAWRDEHVKEALDLCLACKGCKGDCPVNVDIATYKAEFLSHYWEGRIRPRHAFAFGFIDQWSRLASVAPSFVNLFTQLPGLSVAAKFAAGMPQQRQIPAFAPYTFKSWFRQNAPRTSNGHKVILWADTFNNYFFPETAQAAAEVLTAAGCDVHVPMQHLCCGRPLYDYGFLDTAKRYLRKIMHTLREDIENGTPIVVLEPSCASVFRDELHELMPNDLVAKKLRSNVKLLGEFLDTHTSFHPPKLRRKAIVHGHCHHKAIMRMDAEQKLLSRMALDVNELASGCCGMAGSFGYEKDKYDVSIAVGERVLLPAVRKAEVSTLVIADGFSCREQVQQQTSRHALHPAEVLKLALDNGERGTRTAYPEDEFVVPRVAAQKRGMLRAGLVAASAVAVTAWLLIRRK